MIDIYDANKNIIDYTDNDTLTTSACKVQYLLKDDTYLQSETQENIEKLKRFMNVLEAKVQNLTPLVSPIPASPPPPPPPPPSSLNANTGCYRPGYVKNDQGECVQQQASSSFLPTPPPPPSSFNTKSGCYRPGYVKNDQGECVQQQQEQVSFLDSIKRGVRLNPLSETDSRMKEKRLGNAESILNSIKTVKLKSLSENDSRMKAIQEKPDNILDQIKKGFELKKTQRAGRRKKRKTRFFK
jgi:hypothetical protein